MRTGFISMVIMMGLLGTGAGITNATDAMTEKEASPTIK